MDVIFTIVSRNYAAQAATLMESLAKAEPGARRIVIATDGPQPGLEPFAEVVEATSIDAPFGDMCVYYDALELNTAVKPYVFKWLLGEPGATSVTYLDPDIFVYRPLTPIREGLVEAELVLTPHITRPLLGDANPNDQAMLRAGIYNLGFCAMRASPKTRALAAWWADRCRFDCRVDLNNGLFTDQKWMDLSPGFVDTLAIHRGPDLNLAYWNIEGRTLEKSKDGWRVDDHPLGFFHFSGFDPHRPKVLSKHQNRISVTAGSPLAHLLAEFAEAMLRNGHAETSSIPYAHARFDSGRLITPPMRRRALRAARAGGTFPDGLGAATESWFDSPDPEAASPGLPDITRLMDQVWRDSAAADHFDRETAEGRLAFHQWYADNAAALGADAEAVKAAERLARRSGGSARSTAADVWTDTPWTGPAAQALDWLREDAEGLAPRACLAMLAARGDLRQRFGADADGLLAWCIGPEAAAGRFAMDLLPARVIEGLAKDTRLLFQAAQLSERAPCATDLRRRLGAGFGAGERAGWPEALTGPLREAFLKPADGYPAPFVRLFLEIWEQRPDLQRLYPLTSLPSRVRYLRWLTAGGLAEYGVELSALPDTLRNHPLMRLAEVSVRRHRKPVVVEPRARASQLVVSEQAETLALPDGVLAFDPVTGRFHGSAGPSAPPRDLERVCFTGDPGFVPADVIALRARGLSWREAVGVWDAATLADLNDASVALGFVDEIWSPSGIDRAGGRPVRALNPKSPLEAQLAGALVP